MKKLKMFLIACLTQKTSKISKMAVFFLFEGPKCTFWGLLWGLVIRKESGASDVFRWTHKLNSR